MIARNSIYPVENSAVSTPLVKGQSNAAIEIFEGEEERAIHNHFLGAFGVALPPDCDEDTKIETNFAVDNNGVLHVTARVPSTGETGEIKLNVATADGRMNNSNRAKYEQLIADLTKEHVE